MITWETIKYKIWEALGAHNWPGMDRRQWWPMRHIIGYRTSKMPLFLPFSLYGFGVFWIFLMLPTCVILWLLGITIDKEMWNFAVIAMPLSIPCLIFLPVIFGQRATIINTKRGKVTEWRGLALPFLPIIPLMIRRYSLKNISSVVLDDVLSGDRKDQRMVFAVKLITHHRHEITVVEKRSLLSARNIAERIACTCSLLLKDATGRVATSRSFDELDVPLINTIPSSASNLLSTDCAIQFPIRTAEPWVVTIPRPPYRGWNSIILSIISVILFSCSMYAYPSLKRAGQPSSVPLEQPTHQWEPESPWPSRLARVGAYGVFTVTVLTGLTCTIALITAIIFLYKTPYGWRIVVNKNELCVDRIGCLAILSRRRKRQRLDELEELRVEGERGPCHLLAISDKYILTIGDNLSRKDAEILRQELELALRRMANESNK